MTRQELVKQFKGTTFSDSKDALEWLDKKLEQHDKELIDKILEIIKERKINAYNAPIGMTYPYLENEIRSKFLGGEE